MQKHDVYNYTCFKKFLTAYAHYARSNLRAWSYTKWAKRLGLKGTASLTLVISGKRLPGPLMTERFIQYFKFDNRERRYFLDLIQFERMERKGSTLEMLAGEKERLEIERQLALNVTPQEVRIEESKLPEIYEFLNQVKNDFITRFSKPEAAHLFVLNIDLTPTVSDINSR